MPKGWSDDEIETAARMYAAGESYARIGKAIKKTGGAVRCYIYDHRELFPEPRERKGSLPGKAFYIRNTLYIRRCHDCGRPTTDYRCPACWARLRSKGRYAPKGDASDMDTVTYGPAQ